VPHFIIEHGNALMADTDRQAALSVAAECGAACGFIRPEDIKIRLRACDDFLAVDGRRSFMHITVRMLEGRSDDKKTRLAICLRDAFGTQFPQIESISIEICDMHAESYKKFLR
jgi:5-carboxymethyl-2-hydroxymuconate isomerase